MLETSDESIPPRLIEASLERVLGSRRFRGSARKRRFLKFVVEETQAGRADRIKAFTIAIDVFDRDATFDPLLDPVVRIQAGRIRRCLEQYYLGEGADDPVRITIPKGGYVPRFSMKLDGAAAEEDSGPPGEDRLEVAEERAGPTPAAVVETPSPAPAVPSPSRSGVLGAAKRRVALAGGAVAAALALLLAFGWFTPGAPPSGKGEKFSAAIRGPSIMVQPFTNGTGNPAQDSFAQGFAEDVIAGLIRFKSAFIFGADAAVPARSGAEARRSEPNVNPDYVLKGSIRQAADQIQVNVALIDAKDQRYVWSNTYQGNLTASNTIDLRQDIAVQVARALAQSNGVIHSEELQSLAKSPPNSMSSYECMLRARQYWRQSNRDAHAQVRTCLENATKTDPLYADAWAALAMVYLDEAWLGFNPVKTRPDPVASAQQLAMHAVALAPDNPLPHQALGRAYWMRRDTERGIAAYEQALALNPNDADILADLGRCYSLIGEWDRGIPLLREAFVRNPGHPSWYRIIFSLHHYVHGRYDDALAEARRVDPQQGILPHVALAMIYGQMGRAADATYEVGEILRQDPKFGDKAIAEFERRNINRATIDKIVDGLAKAGLVVSPQWASTEER